MIRPFLHYFSIFDNINVVCFIKNVERVGYQDSCTMCQGSLKNAVFKYARPDVYIHSSEGVVE